MQGLHHDMEEQKYSVHRRRDVDWHGQKTSMERSLTRGARRTVRARRELSGFSPGPVLPSPALSRTKVAVEGIIAIQSYSVLTFSRTRGPTLTLS